MGLHTATWRYKCNGALGGTGFGQCLILVSPSPASSPTCPRDLAGEPFCAFPRGSSLALFILHELTNPGFVEGLSNHGWHGWPSRITGVG